MQTFFTEIYFSKVSILPSFEISIKQCGGFSDQSLYFYPYVDKTYLSYALVHNFHLLVQLLLQDCFDAIAQQKSFTCKDNFNDKKLVVSARSK